MDVLLMKRSGSFSFREPGEDEKTVLEDLRLDSVIGAMAGNDREIRSAAVTALSFPSTDPDEILYRQDVLKDVLSHPGLIGGIRKVLEETESERRSSWCWFAGDSVSGMFSSSVTLLKIYLSMTGRLRRLLESAVGLSSEGLTGLRDMLSDRFSDSFLEEAEDLLKELSDGKAIVMTASPGRDMSFSDLDAIERAGLSRSVPGILSPSFTIAERDDTGHDDLRLMKEKALAPSATVLAGAARSLERFFTGLSEESAFYAGAERLYGILTEAGAPICFPSPRALSEKVRKWKELTDPSLILEGKSVSGNDMEETEKGAFIVTGANGGGKTTFLRSAGCAWIMMQAGLFVTAEEFTAPVRNTVRTHFVSGESGESGDGRLMEELSHMKRITEGLGRGGLLIMNEAFSSTDERDGSIIASGIFRALLERGTDMFIVTHLIGFSGSFSEEDAVHLTAERLPDGKRTHRIVRGMPEGTAYGMDIWEKVFGKEPPK